MGGGELPLQTPQGHGGDDEVGRRRAGRGLHLVGGDRLDFFSTSEGRRRLSEYFRSRRVGGIVEIYTLCSLARSGRAVSEVRLRDADKKVDRAILARRS
ncbi:hypothetical protein DEO23_01910 [Brachybacterium endophyticum]|uniref:Uncharacterized protein n=1 Tax=Brachybacterium endophyticum TaxID=2182385 RepID=A0A2U2RNH2_9MICO|nr:hypothetical protein DEO23_01910 [Brachybacterium endophyticum]